MKNSIVIDGIVSRIRKATDNEHSLVVVLSVEDGKSLLRGIDETATAIKELSVLRDALRIQLSAANARMDEARRERNEARMECCAAACVLPGSRPEDEAMRRGWVGLYPEVANV